MHSVDDLLVDIQRLGIELEEAHKDNSRLLDEHAKLRDAVNHNADMYRRDVQTVIDLLSDVVLEGSGYPDEERILARAKRIYDAGREELKRTMEVQ